MRLVRHFDESPGQIYVAVNELEPPPRLFIAPQNLIFLPPPPEQDSDFWRARPQDLILRSSSRTHISRNGARPQASGPKYQRRPRSSRPYPVSESQRGLTATTANVENLLALGRLQRIDGRKSQGFDLADHKPAGR